MLDCYNALYIVLLLKTAWKLQLEQNVISTFGNEADNTYFTSSTVTPLGSVTGRSYPTLEKLMKFLVPDPTGMLLWHSITFLKGLYVFANFRGKHCSRESWV